MRKAILIAATISTILGSGCATEVRYLAAPLPLPPRPVLPSVRAQDLAPLPDQVYRVIVDRERLRREYSEELEAIICATNEEPTDERCR